MSISVPLREKWNPSGGEGRRPELPDWAQGPPGSLTLSGTENGGGTGRRKEVSGAIFMCVLGVGEQEEGQETHSQPLPQLPFPPISAGHPHRRQGGPQFLSHLDKGGRVLEWEEEPQLVFTRGEEVGGSYPSLQCLAVWEGCTLPEAIPLPSGGKSQRKQRFWPR